MIEVIQWISLVLLWIVTGLNVVVMIRTKRLNKELDEAVQLWRERAARLEQMIADMELLRRDSDEVDGVSP